MGGWLGVGGKVGGRSDWVGGRAGWGWVGLGGRVGRGRWVGGQVGERVDGRAGGAMRALCADAACRVAHDRGLREANSCHTFTMVSTRVG